MKNIFSRPKKDIATNIEQTEDHTAYMPAEAPAFMPATSVLRESITRFVIQTLQPYVDEKGLSVSGLHFYIACNNQQQEEAARIALYADRPGMFKKVQLERQLLNYFIQMDADWFFEWHIISSEQLPENSIRKDNFGLRVVRPGDQSTSHASKALVEVLAGQTHQNKYELDPQKQVKFYIGRTHQPKLSSGKIQQNDIVFLGSDEPGFNKTAGSPNLHVSRNHACIVYDAGSNNWLLYPDKGGLPENGNKLKVHTGDDKVKWLHIYGIAHTLCNGDQVELGGHAIFRFSLVV